jgi:hypothetical protein
MNSMNDLELQAWNSFKEVTASNFWKTLRFSLQKDCENYAGKTAGPQM